MMKSVYLPLMLMLITASEFRLRQNMGATRCKTILANDNDEASSEAKGWMFGYISALNEMMQQRFDAATG